MKRNNIVKLFAGILATHLAAMCAFAEARVSTDYNDNDRASANFKFKNVPSPSKNDAGAAAKFSVIDGEANGGSGGVERLNDGILPTEEDAPSDNFFFAAGTDGGRVVADLGRVTEVKQVNSYSWHPNSRGPQVYTLYASDGTSAAFNAKPKKGTDPASCGWTLVAKVDTRDKSKTLGGQHAVSISDSDGSLGNYRYLLFVISRTEDDDDFGNTFYSEVDIVAKDDPAPIAAASVADLPSNSFTIHSPDGQCEIVITTVGEKDLQDWATNKLAPALAEWYPKIAAMLPSDGYTPPKRFTVNIKPGRGVAATGGTRINANATWLKGQLKHEAVGSLIHEEVHVIQQYGRARRNNPNAASNPGWLVEGIADYIRFYKFEPETHGADINERGTARARYDRSYRVTANFLNWVTEKYDADIVRKLNAAMRDGNYSPDIWKSKSGKTVEELGDEWKAGLEKNVKTSAAPKS